jgi:protein translocase SecG subunit
MHTALIILLVLVSVALITVVLLQSGKSAGLSGAISGGAEQLFGFTPCDSYFISAILYFNYFGSIYR